MCECFAASQHTSPSPITTCAPELTWFSGSLKTTETGVSEHWVGLKWSKLGSDRKPHTKWGSKEQSILQLARLIVGNEALETGECLIISSDVEKKKSSAKNLSLKYSLLFM